MSVFEWSNGVIVVLLMKKKSKNIRGQAMENHNSPSTKVRHRNNILLMDVLCFLIPTNAYTAIAATAIGMQTVTIYCVNIKTFAV